jgi:hypothetical protein
MPSADRLLGRLERVRQAGPGRWIARCPAHEDKGPSLSIRELDDGRVLLNDFGGCETSDVLAAVGLTFSDLFPERRPGSGPAGGSAPTSSRIPPRDLLEIISEETSVVAIIAADFLARRSIPETDWQRLAKAASRIGLARDHAYGR